LPSMGKHARLKKMAKIDPKIVEEYQKAFALDPNSKVFAVLGEAYLEMGIVEQAENILRRGITKHPKYPAGYLVLAKVCIHKKDLYGALRELGRVIELSPDNLLAHQLMGETHLSLKNPKDALKSYKMALFLSPTNPRAQQVVSLLEKLTADEFEQDLFTMRPLMEQLPDDDITQVTTAPVKPENMDSHLERVLSLVDALIVRQQTDVAKQKLLEMQKRFPGNSEIESRLLMLEADEEIEHAIPIKPLASREKHVINEKIQRLQRLLKALEKRLDIPY